MTTLAIQVVKDKIGAAYYDPDIKSLFILSVTAFDLTSIETLRRQTNPRTILIHSRAPEIVLIQVQASHVSLEESLLEQVPSSNFSFPLAKDKLEKLEFESDLNSTKPQIALDAHLQFQSNKESIGCAGAVLKQLSQTQTVNSLNEIKLFRLDQYMYINQDSLWALSVFDAQAHPNMHSNVTGHATSLYALLNKTRTSMGGLKLRNWLICPLQSIQDIQHRQQLVGLFLEPENIPRMQQIQKQLPKIKNIFTTLTKLNQRICVQDWTTILTYLESALEIVGLLIPFKNHYFLELFFNNATLEAFQSLYTQLNQTIDIAESKSENRIVIKPHIDEELDQMKRFYHGLDSLLSDLASRIKLPPNPGQSFTIVYFPQLGFLINIQFDENTPKEAYNIPSLTFQFMAENCGYYKNREMADLDTEIGDIHSNIADRELEIMQTQREIILSHQVSLLQMCNLIAELDTFLALAESAFELNYVCPSIEEDAGIFLIGSRHPTLELQIDNFVSNDVSIGHHQNNRGLTITGPNSSGKSVFMQQIALITLMAHIGSYVPCTKATIGIVDKILVRMRTKTSVLLNESSFMTDLKQASLVINQSTEKSLVLLDEFGKGTIPTDGIGLFAGTLKTLNEKCTKLVVATHFYEVFTDDFIQLLDSLVFCHFSTFKSDTQFEFMFQLTNGLCERSLGIQCAKRSGLSDNVIERATIVANAINNGEPIPSLYKNKDQSEAAGLISSIFWSLDFNSCDLETELWRNLRNVEHLFV